MKSRSIYLLLALVFVVFGALATIPTFGDVTRAVTALPAAAAVIAAIFQLVRDQAAHDRAIVLQAAQNGFAVGATSHMASVAFDKHVGFSEEYVTPSIEESLDKFEAAIYLQSAILPHLTRR